MKKLFLAFLLATSFLCIHAQDNVATLKTSSRLFRDKDDLTSVILIIPKDSVVKVIEFDDTYLLVNYQNSFGYIFSRDARYAVAVVTEAPAVKPETGNEPLMVPANNDNTRYEYLKRRYGTEMAERLFARKIWKGMNADMVKDSWGPAKKIQREVDGSTIKEEWLYTTTWLYIENSVLIDWGPIRRP